MSDWVIAVLVVLAILLAVVWINYSRVKRGREEEAKRQEALAKKRAADQRRAEERKRAEAAEQAKAPSRSTSGPGTLEEVSTGTGILSLDDLEAAEEPAAHPRGDYSPTTGRYRPPSKYWVDDWLRDSGPG